MFFRCEASHLCSCPIFPPSFTSCWAVDADEAAASVDDALASDIAKLRVEDSSAQEGGKPAFDFTEAEREMLLQLPRREHLIEPGGLQEARLLRGLAGILAAYAYDRRTTQGCPTCESAWTICTLSPLLSWLDTPPTEADVVRSAVRRMLSYPYLRHWVLACTAVRDAATILRAGVRPALRCLLRVRDIMRASDVYYLHNTLYIDDYCVWIQRVQPAALISCGQRVVSALDTLDKAHVDLDLDSIGACVGAIDDDGDEDSDEDSDEESDEESDEDSDNDDSDGDDSDSTAAAAPAAAPAAPAAPRPLIVELSSQSLAETEE